MTAKTIKLADWLHSSLVRTCRLHFVFVALYSVYIIASDATHLITPELVEQRWTVNALVLSAAAMVWYLARLPDKSANFYRSLVFVLISVDILMASVSIYSQRGMASRAVILFVIPILISGLLLNRAAVWAVALISAAAYSLSAVKYFVDYFNEGYKAELYIEVGFYCGVFLLVAGMLDILLRLSKPK